MDNNLLPKSVYLASALSNSELNCRIAKGISKLGCYCYLPQDDPLNKTLKKDGNAIAVRNRVQIKKCDYLIAVSQKMGLDTSWEVGYAHGLGKPCLLICSMANVDDAQSSAMSYYSVNAVITVPNWSSSSEVFAQKIYDATRTWRKFIDSV